MEFYELIALINSVINQVIYTVIINDWKKHS